MRVVGGAARILEITPNSGEAETPPFHRLDRPEQPRDAVVEAVVVRHGEQVKAGIGQFVEHPGRRAEMRPAAFQRRISDEVVGQDLEVREGNVGAPDQVEQRPQRRILECQQPPLDDAVTGQGKSERGSAGPARPRGLATVIRLSVQSADRCHRLSSI